jgi:serine/threonine protein kinase
LSTADDDEKTVSGPSARPDARDDDVATGLQAERRRGRAAAAQQPGHTLPIGTRLRDYEITGLIGEGGFGIVYLAWDHSLQRKVALKEYMPASMAARVNGSSAIVVKSERHLDTFRAGLKSFVNEARLLARFDHPSLVKVYRFWEENGTAYMVMPYYEGPTLKAALAELGHVPSEDELRAWLKPLLDALAVMHAAQCYHRDIAPDNILLTPRGPLLLDFGAARRVIGDMTHAITVVLKPGYAPIEQYGDVASMAQGAWTDLYALACVVYYAITGKTPMSSVERLMEDRLAPLGVTAAGRYSPAFLRAIDAALAVRPGDRPQDERQFRALLDADRPTAPPASADFTGSLGGRDGNSAQASGPSTMPSGSAPELVTWLEPGPAQTRVTPAPAAPTVVTPRAPLAPPAPPWVAPAPDVAPPAPETPVIRTGLGVWLTALVAVVVIAAAIFWWRRDASEPTPIRNTVEPAAAAAPPMAPASAAVPLPIEAVPASVPSLAPVAREPLGASAGEATTAAPIPEPPALESPAAAGDLPSAPAPSQPASTRPRREPSPARSEPPSPRTTPTRAASERCSDILQKASLEALTADEAAYLKRECR